MKIHVNNQLNVSETLLQEINKEKCLEGVRKATGLNIEYETMEELLKIADTHKVSKSGILRCFMRDGLDSIKSNSEVEKMGYDGMGHYTSMLEPSIIDSVEAISTTSKATKSNVMRHCVLIGLKKYRDMNNSVTDEKPFTEKLDEFNSGYIESIEKSSKPEDVDPTKPQTEEDLQRTIEKSNFAEPLPLEDVEKSDFEKFMDKAVESMKSFDIKGRQLTITIKFE